MHPVERVVRRTDRFQQANQPLAFLFAVVKKFGDDRAGALAALLAYYGFLAIFPLLLLLTTILGFAMGSSADLEESVLNSALRDFPVVGEQLRQAIHPLEGNGLALAIGLLGLFWGSLGVTQAGQLAMAEVWNVPGVDRPPFVGRMLRGVGLLGVLGLGVMVTTVTTSLSVFGGGGRLAGTAGTVLSVGLNIGQFVLAFRVLTVRSVRMRDLVPGAVFAGLAWSVLQVVGAYLVTNQLRHAGQVYGFFAGVIGLLFWLSLAAQVTLYAAEANVVWARRLWPRSLVQPPLTEADKQAFDDIALQGERRPEQTVESAWTDEATVAPPSGAGRGGGQ